MIISTNSIPPEECFTDLLEKSVRHLCDCSMREADFYQAITPANFECKVCKAMQEVSLGTDFAGSIELVSGHRFPDIIAHGYYGVEVKSTVGRHWTTIGNSVLESTRLEGVKKIYIIFGQISAPFQCRYRKYQECLSDVVVSHSPRYLIDMDLPPKQSIFDKMGVEYDAVRQVPKPISAFVNYYRRQFGRNADTWWLDNGGEATSPVTIDFWCDLPVERRNEITGACFLFHPEIFGSAPTKYRNLTAWLVKRYSIISTNIRDAFTAKGKVKFNVNGQDVMIPRIYDNLLQRAKEFKCALLALSVDDINEIIASWGIALPSCDCNSPGGIYDEWKQRFLSFAMDNRQDGLDTTCKSMVINSIIERLDNSIM